MATAPRTNSVVVRGMRFASPPMCSMSRVCAAWMTAPALKKSSDLKRPWFQTCNSAPPSPRTIQIGWLCDLPSRARPMPIMMIPMFSMLL